MAQVTPNLQLTVWNNLSDPYDSGQLANNFVKIDLHDHSGNGKGVQINGATGIAPDSISSVQIGSNAIGSAELQQDNTDPGSDSNRAVGTDHIKNLAVTASKIANGTITRTKLNRSSVLAVPVVYHTDSKGSLPTVTVDGEALYDGYVIDYAFSFAAVNGSGYSQYYSPDTSSSGRNYMWRLKYNSTTSSWDYLGGRVIEITITADSLAGGGTVNSSTEYAYFYNSWGDNNGTAYVTLPLAGNYETSYTVTAKGLSDGAAIFKAGLTNGLSTSASTYTTDVITGSTSYGYMANAGSSSYVSVSAVGCRVGVSATYATNDSNRRIRIAVGFRDKGTSTATCKIAEQRLVVRPSFGITNFS
jgi:hypothetical protein